MKPQVEPDHYFSQAYNSKERFISYWNQITELTKLGSTSILEIGIGNSFVFNYLKKKGYGITSVDIDARLKPNIIGTVVALPFFDSSFDVVACFEVLEHLPYSTFLPTLRELHRVSRKYLLLSLPDSSPSYPLYLYVPRMGELKTLVNLPILKAKKHEFDGQHYWEIGKTCYSFKKIVSDLVKAGFVVERCFRVFEVPYHRFFILKKISTNSPLSSQ
jgi:SAM-dependent methyltransferase